MQISYEITDKRFYRQSRTYNKNNNNNNTINCVNVTTPCGDSDVVFLEIDLFIYFFYVRVTKRAIQY